MQLAILLNSKGDRPIQDQLFEQIRRMIVEGRLKASDAIPASRELSAQLGISRNTVVSAYERLIAEGYIETQRSVGTFVSPCIPETGLYLDSKGTKESQIDDIKRIPRERGVVFGGRAQNLVTAGQRQIEIDFWAGRPDAGTFPLKMWRRIINRTLLRSGSNLTTYPDPQGEFALRQAIADHLGPARGITATPEQIVVVGGCQDGLNLIARLLVGNGCPVVLENPCYQGAAYVFESYGGKVNAIDVDGEGLVAEQLPEVSKAVAYVTPSHQCPLGATLSLKRRIDVLNWALNTCSYIIEDDYDSDFRYTGSPLTALKGLDTHGSVIYMGTFTKCMGAGLRLGYMVVPKELVEPARKLKTLTSNGQPWLEQAAMAEFIDSGAFGQHLRRIRQLYMIRRNTLAEELKRHFGDVELEGLDGGMHLVWRLPTNMPSAGEIAKRALEVGVGVYSVNSGGSCAISPCRNLSRVLVFGYAALPEEDIREGICRLVSVLPKITPHVKRKRQSSRRTRPNGNGRYVT